MSPPTQLSQNIHTAIRVPKRLAATPGQRTQSAWERVAQALACLAIMLAVNLYAGIIAISILFAVHQYLKRVAQPARWADSKRSLVYQLTACRADATA